MSFKITLIGTGNVATHLAPALERGGNVIHQIYGRTPEKAEAIADNLYSPEVVDSLDFSNSTSDLFLLAIPDAAIEDVASEIVLPDGATIVHTSGTVPLEALEVTAADHYGVFYPLQTFSANTPIDLKEVPLLIEGSDLETEEQLKEMASGISDRVERADSDRRRSLHLAAVFVNNFVNHLLTIGEEICQQHQLDFKMLHPLIRETINKALQQGPGPSQTGPANREDYTTIEQHAALLADQENHQKIYRLLSQSIIDKKYE